MIVRKAPLWLELYHQQGQILKPAQVTLLDGRHIGLSDNKKRLIIFWATWCGPCFVELGRINRLITDGEIRPESVLAITSFEDTDTVRSFVKEKGYMFPVATDRTGLVAEKYNITGTPTIIMVNEKNIIEWTTVGLSPTLEVRIKNFFN